MINCEMLLFCWTMWYNRNMPKSSLTKGKIFMPKGQQNKRYTPEFKIRVVETMHKEKLSYKEIAERFEIAGHDRI